MGLDFLGHPVIQGKALFLSAEDRTSVLRSRLAAICLNHSIDPVVLAEHLYLLDATDAAVLWDVEGRDKKCGPTAHYHELQQFITDREIAFVVIDNSSDTFGADRIDKSSVTRFVRALSRLVHKQHGATLLLSHVNRATAANSRTATENYSDSVSWHNAARSRLYMKASDDGSVRTLAHEKTNYGTLGPTLTLQAMKTCGLELADASEAVDVEQKKLRIELLDNMDKKTIIGLIQEFYDRGEWISPSQASPNGNTYSMLSGEANFPSTLIKKKVLTLCRELERDGYLAREVYRKETQRKQGERWVVTQEGRDWAGVVAKNAPTAPTAPTGENSEVDAVSAGNGEARADPVRQHVGGTRGAARRAQSAQTKKIPIKRKPKSATPSIKAVPEVGAVTKPKRGKKKCAPVQ
jgi:hypothetical protein